MKEEILRMERITQIVDGTTLLDNFNLHIFEGEIMGLVSINYHGQEALVRIICQNIPIHYGYVYFQETLVNNYKHSSMTMNRVAVIEKQSRLVEDLTVVDNIFVLRNGFKKYLINPKILEDQFKQFSKELGIHIDGNQLVSNLSFFEKCVVEMLKAIVGGVKLIVIKDISNFISTTDLIKIHDIIRYYSTQGISFLYICNHHEEAFKICDRISIMKNEKVLKVLSKKEFKQEVIAPYTLDFNRIDSTTAGNISKEGILSFQNVSTDNIHNMNFSATEGECLVFLDMNNTVLEDIIKLMNHEISPNSGKILFDDSNYNDVLSLRKNICFIQENPIHSMLFKEMSYIDNLCFLLDKKYPNLWLSKKIKKSVIQEYEPLLGKDIYCNDITELDAQSLYNLVYYRIHLYHPKVVFCIQPFSGADMYLRRHIVYLINQLRKKKITVIILAVNLSDSLAVADRLMIIEHGKLSKEYHSREFQSFRENQ